MRRHVIPVLAAAVLVVLLLPAIAEASRHTVRDKSGDRVGTVSDGRWGKVWDSDAAVVGEFGFQDNEGIFAHRLSDGRLAWAYRASRRVFRVTGVNGGLGRAVRMEHRWKLQRRVDGHWQTRGYVRRTAGGWGGCAALFVLLWK
jgi:hypothetical protein